MAEFRLSERAKAKLVEIDAYTARLAVSVAKGIAAWLSCREAEVRRHEIGMSPSATSMCGL